MGVRPAGLAGSAVDGEDAPHANAGAGSADRCAAHPHSDTGSHRGGANSDPNPNSDPDAHADTGPNSNAHAHTDTGPTDADTASAFPGGAPSHQP